MYWWGPLSHVDQIKQRQKMVIGKTKTLGESNIAVETFSHSLKTFLNKGHGKSCTVSIIGPANYEKTVILKSLTLLYKTYINPVTLTFNWSLIAEVTFLNDFWWSNQLIPWLVLFLLLEEEGVHLPTPKTHCQWYSAKCWHTCICYIK